MSTQITGVSPGSQTPAGGERSTSGSESKTDGVGGQDTEEDKDVKSVEQPTTVEVTTDSARRDNEALGKYVDTFV